MHENPHRVAWSVLITAFLVFCVSAICVPLGIRWLLVNSTQEQEAAVALVARTVYVTRPTVGVPEVLSGYIQNLPEGTRIETESASRASVSFGSPDSRDPLGSLQIFGETEIQLIGHRTPRFNFSDKAHRINLELVRGRVRASAAVGVTRPVVMMLHTPQAEIALMRPGSYSVEVLSDSTEVSVRDGAAVVAANGESVVLTAGRRTSVALGNPPSGAFSGERNLVRNGSLGEPLSKGWTTYQNLYSADESPGIVEALVKDGRPAVHFSRHGLNWSEVGISQELNHDVRDYRSLRLHVAVWLAFQDLRNCGSLGSECPLMVRLEYEDASGEYHEWLQGFYYLQSSNGSIPTRCVTCPPPTSDHSRIANSVWHPYDSPDLMALLATDGNAPAKINSISIYASGHSFESYVAEVELLAED